MPNDPDRIDMLAVAIERCARPGGAVTITIIHCEKCLAAIVIHPGERGDPRWHAQGKGWTLNGGLWRCKDCG